MTGDVLRDAVMQFQSQVDLLQQLTSDKIFITLYMLLLNKTASLTPGTTEGAASCPEGCHYRCEVTEEYGYLFSDALITTLQNYSTLIGAYHSGRLPNPTGRCPMLSGNGNCITQNTKPHMCVSYYPVSCSDGRISCRYKEEALQEGTNIRNHISQVPFNVARSGLEERAAIQTLFTSNLTELVFNSFAEGTTWMIEHLPDLIPQETFKMLVSTGVRAEKHVVVIQKASTKL